MAKHINPRYTHYVIAAYDSPYGDRGTIVSRHRTLAAAQRAVRNDSGWLAIRDYRDVAHYIAR